VSNTRGSGPSQSALILLLMSAIASAGIYALTAGSPLCLAPLILYIANFALRVVARRSSPDQDILLGFLVLSFLIDDISQVAWGRTIDTWTEALGAILFKSYGLTGMETFAILLSAWLIIRRAPLLFRDWNKLGFLPIFLVGVAVFICSYITGLFGVMSGGQVNTMFIQLRFLHCLPLWVFIGFAIWRDRTFTEKALKWMTIAICLKSLQALFVYFTNYSLFKYDEEYLIDHYFSGFSVVALVCLVYYFFKAKSLSLKGLIAASAIVVAMAYIFNDRRTSYVGVALALATLPCLLPFKILKKYLPHGIGLAIAGALFTMITWNMPMPLGFIGETYRSFGNETGTGEPSYRDLENANLINAVTQSPVSGIGYGKEFDEVFPMPDISYVYERYKMIPHNLFLASWAFGGPLTISALSLLFATMIAFSGRLLKVSREPILFLLGVVSLFYFLQYLTYTFGDLGFQIQRNQMLAGLLLGACFRIGSELALAEKRGEKWV
jgi:hypothetical protein